MADQIPLYPVRSAAAAAANRKRAAYYSAAGPRPGADRHSRNEHPAPLCMYPTMTARLGWMSPLLTWSALTPPGQWGECLPTAGACGSPGFTHSLLFNVGT
ncbi:putative ATPase phospholipid transporting 9B (putative), partial [Homo sapiens]